MQPFLTTLSFFSHRALKACILLAVLLTQPAQGQTLSGTVATESGQPLPGAEILLTDPHSGSAPRGTVADEKGVFEIAAVYPGEFNLLVSFLGYTTFERRINIRPGDDPVVHVRLKPATLLQDEVVVTADRGRAQLTPITFTNLTARELEEQPAMKDLPVLLATLPSITHYSENGNGIGYSTLRMRGFDQRRIAVAVNGIPQNDPEDFNVFWINFFDLQEAVDDIQVQRGAGASFYGPAGIGGAVNIVADPYEPFPYAEAKVGYGSYKTQRYSVEANSGLLGGRYILFGRYSRLLSDGYRDWSWTEFHRFFAGVARYGERSKLVVQGYGGPQRDGLAFAGIPKQANSDEEARRQNFSALTRDVENFHQPHVELLHDWDFAARGRFHQALFWTKGEGYFDFGGTFRSAEYLRLPENWRELSGTERTLPLFITAPDASLLFRAYLDQWQVGWLPRVDLRHALGSTTFGGEVRLHRSLRWGRMEEGIGLPEELVGPANDVHVYSFRGEKVISSMYARHLYHAADRYAVQADVQLTYRRYRVYDERYFGHRVHRPYFFVNPRLGITLHPERPFSAYASLAWANREPRLKSLYDGEEAGAGFEPRFAQRPDGSFDFNRPLIKPERLLDAEFGVRLRRSDYRLDANVFWMEFWDEIVPSGGLDQFGVPRTGNADRSRHVGIELDGSADVTERLHAYGNVTLSRNRFVSFTEFVTTDGVAAEIRRDGNPIAGFPEVVANAGVRLRGAKGLVIRLNAQMAGTQYIDNSGGALGDDFDVDPYLLMHASIQYQPPFSDGLRLAADVNNVLNQNVLLFGNLGAAGPQFFPTATRHVFGSVRYRLP